MIYRKIGKSQIDASAIALGTWAIGGGDWWGVNDDEQSIKTIKSAIDCGINLIDTAPGYGYGKSETIVGKAIQGIREKVILSTKVGLWWLDERGTDFFEIDGISVRRCLEPDTIKREIELSLKRLDTDYIDVYFTHWQSEPPYFTPVKDTMKCLMDLKRQGMIKAIGASNVNLHHIDEYQEYGEFDVIQEKYSILDRRIEDELLPRCIKSDIGMFAYSPLEQGLLTGAVTMDTVYPEKDTRNRDIWIEPQNRINVLNMLKSWEELTQKYNCSIANLVVACTMMQPGISHVLCGARKPHHIIETAKSADIKISTDDLKRMRKDFESLKATQKK